MSKTLNDISYEKLDFLRRANEIDRFRAELEADSTELELDMAEYALDCELEAEIDANPPFADDEPVPYSPTTKDFSQICREGPFTIYIP